MTAVLPPVALFDTQLVLSCRSVEEPAYGFVDRWIDSKRKVMICEVTALALLCGCRDEEDRRQQLFFLSQSRILRIKAKISERAFAVMRELPVPVLLSANDALVAATALIEKLPLYALDPDRYSGVPGLTVLPAR